MQRQWIQRRPIRRRSSTVAISAPRGFCSRAPRNLSSTCRPGSIPIRIRSRNCRPTCSPACPKRPDAWDLICGSKLPGIVSAQSNTSAVLLSTASALESTFDEIFALTLTFPAGMQPPSKSRFEMLLGGKEHEMHHRAQLMVVQRMLGIVPHLTRDMQARMAQMTQQQPKGAGA